MQKELPWTGERLVASMPWSLVPEHLSRYAFVMDLCKNKKVLDAACGEGYGTSIIAQYATSIVGVDIDEEVIDHAKKKYKGGNLSFVSSDVCKMPFDDASFEVIISFETLEHVCDHADLLSEFKRVLIPGGLLIISTPDKQHYTIDAEYKNPHHVKELFSSEFTGLLQQYFLNSELFCQQNFLGSIIYSMNSKKTISIEKVKKYRGSLTAIYSDESLNKPLYRIGLASDAALPDLEAMFFQDKQVIQKSVAEVESLYRNTHSFRLGNKIIRSLNSIRNIFTNKS